MIDRCIIFADTWLSCSSQWNPILALSAEEKWSAMRGMSTQGLISQHWLSMAMIAILIVLMAMLVRVSLNRVAEEKLRNQQTFAENVRRHNLSVREYQLLNQIVKESGLRRPDAIFREEAAFERGADRVLAKRPDNADAQWDQRMHAEIGFLRDKLGLTGMDLGLTVGEEEEEETSTTPEDGSRKRHRLSSRDLPEGKQLHITRRMGNPEDDFHGTIITNNSEHLDIQIDVPVKISFGEVWRARYYFGATVWEFETTVVSYDGNNLVLRHSNDVKFVNRRRFVRVPTEHQAYIAQYPFLHDESTPADEWVPVNFVPATLTELAGPGLRLETSLDASIGDRVLVAFRVEMAEGSGGKSNGCVIQTMGTVKRLEPIFDRQALSISLIGLKDGDIDQLVRLTNKAAQAADEVQDDTPAPVRPEQAAQDEVLEAVIDQGGADDHV